MKLYRAHVYRMARMDRYHDSMDCMAYFEAPEDELALATVRRVVAAAWNVPQTEVDADRLFAEDQVLAMSGMPARAGDMRLLEVGWNMGPLFVEPAQMLVFGRPLTVARIQTAIERVRAWRANPANAHAFAGLPRPNAHAAAGLPTLHPHRRSSDWTFAG